MSNTANDSLDKVSRRNTLTAQQKELLQGIRKLLKARITYRELECSRFLILGYSANHIAKLLKISPRTAEYYINSLKLKCNCDTKWHLSRYLRERLGIVINSALDTTVA